MECFLAIDIGASSGRHIVGTKENGRLCLKEVYRFENGMKHDNKDASLYWDVDELYGEILNGMKACKEAGFEPKSMGIDTWGVDFVLLNEAGERIGNAIAYRDKRTEQMDKIVYETVQEQELYLRTGTKKQQFNTIYQTKDWDWELIRMLGYPEKIFQKIRRPGTVLGKLKEEVAEKVGFSCDVILPATHDTGSAIMAIPSTEENVMYISSGTWSLMGSECLKPICTEQSRNLNFTNEGGYDYRFRFLKNIMGLWMIQSIRREQQKTYSFAEICGMAEKCKMFPSRVDVNSPVFLAPESMTEAVKAECRKTGQTVPESLGELAAVVYESLAVCYGKTAAEIGKLTGKKYDVLHVIGGGANVDYLNQITADYTGKIIVAGPGEATALGNILAQMLQAGVFKNLQEARGAVALSFPLRKFYPKGV